MQGASWLRHSCGGAGHHRRSMGPRDSDSVGGILLKSRSPKALWSLRSPFACLPGFAGGRRGGGFGFELPGLQRPGWLLGVGVLNVEPCQPMLPVVISRRSVSRTPARQLEAEDLFFGVLVVRMRWGGLVVAVRTCAHWRRALTYANARGGSIVVIVKGLTVGARGRTLPAKHARSNWPR